MRRYRVAGVGAGYFSQFHYDAWRRIDQADLIAVADPDETAAAARAHLGATPGGPAPRTHPDLDALLNAGEPPDILDVVTPPPTHLALIERAFAAGVQTVICQKPFCVDIQAAEQAAALAERLGRRLVVHENFRFQPWWRAIKRALDAGTCGQVRQAAFRLRPGDGRGPRAYLDRQPYFQTMPRFLIHETGVHWIDIFQFLMGPPDGVFADLRRLNPAIAGEDAGMFLFLYDDGRRALFDGNRLLDHAAENRRRTMGEALIEGDGGALTLDGAGRVRRRAHGSDLETELVFERPEEGFGGDCVRALQQHVVDALEGRGALENAARDYLTVLRIEAAVYRSAETGAAATLGADAAGERSEA